MQDAGGRGEIKRHRVKMAFVETAARIITLEGAQAATVRRVAADSGYTLATLYKYVGSLDELFWLARRRLVEDVASFFKANGRNHIASWDNLKDELRSFVSYFAGHPHVFHFLYSYRLDTAKKPADAGDTDAGLGAAMAPVAAFLYEKMSHAGVRATPETERGTGARGAGSDPDGSAGMPPEEPVQASLAVLVYALMGVLCVYLGGNDAMDMDGLDHALDQVCVVLERSFYGQ